MVEHSYLEGDCLEILKTFEKDTYKLIMTSPPYNIGKEYELKESIEHYLETQEEVIDELIRVLHPQGSICWQVGNFVDDSEVFPLDIIFYNIFKKRGLRLRNRIIWQFGHGLHSSKKFSGRYETILWFTKNDDYTFNLDSVRIPSKYPGKKHFKGPHKGKYSGNPKGKNPSDIWNILLHDWEKEIWDIPNVKANHIEKTEHPCQYPIELVERCVLALTDKFDWVLDPYAGVGSTMLASLKNDRRVTGIEKIEKYRQIGLDRLSKLEQNELKFREIGTPVYDHTKSKLSEMPQDFFSDKHK